MKNILLPLGVSDNAKHVLHYAIEFAKTTKATIYIMDAFNPSYPNAHLLNFKEVVNRNNFNRIKELVAAVDHQGISLQMVSYEGDVLAGIVELDKKVGLDLILTGPSPNANDDSIYLGPTAGRLVKKTDIPVWIIPIEAKFSTPKKALFAFKKGQVKGNRSLAPIHDLQAVFNTEVELLLVKTPGKKREDLQIDHEIVELSDHMTSTENGTVYQGVLEFFRGVQPDVLTVFARQRGFFEKLIASDIVYKKDFYSPIPLLVLKNRS